MDLNPAAAGRAGALCLLIAGCGVVADKAIPVVPSGPIPLRDVTSSLGLPLAVQPCLVFRDFTRDGQPDLLVAPTDANGQLDGGLYLYVNRGGTFELTVIPRSGGPSFRTCAGADYDGDGWQDFVAVAGEGSLLLMHNDGGDGTSFTDLSSTIRDNERLRLNTIGFVDFDGDGLLDLFGGSTLTANVASSINRCDFTDRDIRCYPSKPIELAPPTLLRNTGAEGFVAVETIATSPAYNLAVNFFDWDQDGAIDLFMSNDYQPNNFLRNLGGGRFEDLLPAIGARVYNHGMGVVFGDFDDDGHWDFFSCDIGPDQMYFGSAPGKVEDRTYDLGLTPVTGVESCWSPLLEDLDNDGHADLFIPSDLRLASMDEYPDLVFGRPPESMRPSAQQADLVLLNHGSVEFSMGWVPHRINKVMAGIAIAAAADYDGDGLLDIAVVTIDPGFELRLLHNEFPMGRRFLEVRLEGAGANRDAAGAVVTLRDGDQVMDRRAVGTGGLATSWTRVHFGLGERSTAGPVVVRWPDGAVQEVPAPIAANQTIVVKRE